MFRALSLRRPLSTTKRQLRFQSTSSSPSTTTQTQTQPDPFRDAKYSVEEALFLAKEAGIFTTGELQKQIIRSPSFSPDKNPVLIENFFQPQRDIIDDEVEENSEENDETNMEGLTGGEVVAYGCGEVPQVDRTPLPRKNDLERSIHDTIVKNFCPEWEKTFWHNGKEWLSRSEGRGTRKRSTAHVVLVRGTGVIKVNGDEDFWKRWWIINDRMMACQPFYLTKTCGIYDCFVAVSGGGLSGQAGAMRLAVARALFNANPACSADLKQALALYEDVRQRIPKTDAQPGAYAKKSWSKR